MGSLPAPCLALVQALELMPRIQVPAWKQLNHLALFLSALPRAMPGLRHLYIGFDSNLYELRIDPKTKYLLSESILQVIDERLVRAADGTAWTAPTRPPLQIEVGMPTSVFFATFNVGIKDGRKWEAPGWRPGPGLLANGAMFERKRIWRAVEGAEGESGIKGYWIGETDSDMPVAWMVNMPRYWE
jgi:hypothetical protein